MKAFLLISLLPIDIVRHIQKILAHEAVNTIIRAYYRRTLIKIKVTEYFCQINDHIPRYGYYRINTLPNFVNNLSLASRYINHHDDETFWWNIYINIQKTLAYEESLFHNTIIEPHSIDVINFLSNDLRLSLGCYLTYHYGF
jgi:hypothetical protein